MNEACAICSAGPTINVERGMDLALCEAHWSRWLWRYLGADDHPCAAHVFRKGDAA